MLYCHSRVGGNPDQWQNSTFYETINHYIDQYSILIDQHTDQYSLFNINAREKTY